MDPRGPRAAPPLNHGDLEGEHATQTQKRQYSIHTDGRDRQTEREKRLCSAKPQLMWLSSISLPIQIWQKVHFAHLVIPITRAVLHTRSLLIYRHLIHMPLEDFYQVRFSLRASEFSLVLPSTGWRKELPIGVSETPKEADGVRRQR